MYEKEVGAEQSVPRGVILVHTQDLSLSLEKEGDADTCDTTDEPGGHYAT